MAGLDCAGDVAAVVVAPASGNSSAAPRSQSSCRRNTRLAIGDRRLAADAQRSHADLAQGLDRGRGGGANARSPSGIPTLGLTRLSQAPKATGRGLFASCKRPKAA